MSKKAAAQNSTKSNTEFGDFGVSGLPNPLVSTQNTGFLRNLVALFLKIETQNKKIVEMESSNLILDKESKQIASPDLEKLWFYTQFVPKLTNENQDQFYPVFFRE